jgi:hypothetical protein
MNKPIAIKGDDGDCRTASALKGCEGLIVDVNANNLGGVARSPSREPVDESENRDGRDS